MAKITQFSDPDLVAQGERLAAIMEGGLTQEEIIAQTQKKMLDATDKAVRDAELKNYIRQKYTPRRY